MSKILVALADERVLSYLLGSLAERGYEVHGANSIESVLDSLSEERFDAFVSDIFQPLIDGVALFATVARASPRTRIVALMDFQSARAKTYDLNLWVDSVIVKPFTAERVAEEVSFILAGEKHRRVEEPVSA